MLELCVVVKGILSVLNSPYIVVYGRCILLGLSSLARLDEALVELGMTSRHSHSAQEEMAMAWGMIAFHIQRPTLAC